MRCIYCGLTAVALAAGMLLATGCNSKDAPSSPSKPKDALSDRSGTPAPTNEKTAPKTPPTDFPKTTVESLAKEFATDETAADKKYAMKSLLVEGTLVSVEKKDAVVFVFNGYKDDKVEIIVRIGIALIDPVSSQAADTAKPGDKFLIACEYLSPGFFKTDGKPTALSLSIGKVVK